MPDPKPWYSRGYLPHFDRPGLVQAVTFRLHDSMPATVLQQWQQDLAALPPVRQLAERQKRMAAYLDAGQGDCWLRDPAVAALVAETLLHWDGQRYQLLAWVIMPNHLHALLEMRTGHPLARIVQSWKTWTARRANELLGRNGPFWFRDFYDRYIRDEEHFATAKSYIEQNPVKAGLCHAPEDWRWSSASKRPPGPPTSQSATVK